MNLNIAFDNPTPIAPCGYKALYRRKGDPSYTELSASGATSGQTSIHIGLSAPASYEGTIQSNCCAESLSDTLPFGVNAYSPVLVLVSIRAVPLNYIATVTAPYGNPYATVITGTFMSSGSTLNYSLTFPANSTSSSIVLANSASSASEYIHNTTVGAIAPVYDNGGAIQQYDPVSTPPYFQFFSSGTTAPAYNGIPITYPSFTLDQFHANAYDQSGNILAGALFVSWIQDVVYNSGASPYNVLTFKVYDGATQIGATSFDPTILGLRQTSIQLTKLTNPRTPGYAFTMKVMLSDTSLSSAKTFYLPG